MKYAVIVKFIGGDDQVLFEETEAKAKKTAQARAQDYPVSRVFIAELKCQVVLTTKEVPL